jgi:hypothetical protein
MKYYKNKNSISHLQKVFFGLFLFSKIFVVSFTISILLGSNLHCRAFSSPRHFPHHETSQHVFKKTSGRPFQDIPSFLHSSSGDRDEHESTSWNRVSLKGVNKNHAEKGNDRLDDSFIHENFNDMILSTPVPNESFYKQTVEGKQPTDSTEQNLMSRRVVLGPMEVMIYDTSLRGE